MYNMWKGNLTQQPSIFDQLQLATCPSSNMGHVVYSQQGKQLFSKKYPYKFSQLICTSCADDLQPFSKRSQAATMQFTLCVCGGKEECTLTSPPHEAFFRAHTHNHERGIHLHSLCLPHSHVSSLLLLMNTCAAINPFFMCKSHVRNYLVQLSHMAGRTERGSTRWGGGPKTQTEPVQLCARHSQKKSNFIST